MIGAGVIFWYNIFHLHCFGNVVVTTKALIIHFLAVSYPSSLEELHSDTCAPFFLLLLSARKHLLFPTPLKGTLHLSSRERH